MLIPLALPMLLALSAPKLTVPDCTGPDRYPATMAFVSLKNAGLTDNEKTDFSKIAVTRLVSERISKRIHRQVHYIVLPQKNGSPLEVMTVSNASFDECSEGNLLVFLGRSL